jgi:hypothetical protein
MKKIRFIPLDSTHGICPELSTFMVDITDEDDKIQYLGRLTCETETMHELGALLELGARRAGNRTEMEVTPWKSPSYS